MKIALVFNLMDIYAQNILDHFKNPRNRGILENAETSFKSLNASCGDEITAYLKLDNDKIKEISFDGHGCAIALAAASILSESLVNKRIIDILTMDLNDVRAELGIDISNRRSKCALIALRSIQGALNKLVENK